MGDTRQYFLGVDGEQIGPYSRQEVFEKMRRNEVTEVDVIWWEGQVDWLPLSQTEFCKSKKEEKVFERKRPQIGGDIGSVLSGNSSIESHPTFARGDAEPAFRVSQVSPGSFIDYRSRLILTLVFVVIVSSLSYIYFSQPEVPKVKESAQSVKQRNLNDRQSLFSKAVSTLMTNPSVSIPELQNLIKENPQDDTAKQAVEQLTSFYRTMQRYGEAGQLMMQVNRPAEAVRFFSMDPALTLENEKATWEAYMQAKGEDRKTFLLQNIQILVGQMQDVPRALERIKIFESEFPRSSHPYGYYLKGTDEKISDLFSRTSFYFVQNLISFLNTELPQLKLSSRPLVEIKKSKREMYKIVGSYKGDVVLNQDRLEDIFFTFWFANEAWHIVDTNLTKERRAYAIKERGKISSLSMPGEAMLRYMEGVFRSQFPKVALHEVVDSKK